MYLKIFLFKPSFFQMLLVFDELLVCKDKELFPLGCSHLKKKY